MRALLSASLLLLFLGLSQFSPQLHGAEPVRPKSYIAGGIGLEQLTYKEQIPEIALSSSDTDLTNWVLFLEARKALAHFFIGARVHIPLSTDDALEYWTRGGEFEQTNSLAYQWTRADTHAGYFLHPLLNPYVGIRWSYAEQKRSHFENIDITGIYDETATEEVYSVAALLGIQGEIPFSARWFFSYFAEYQLPFYSNITNDGLPGWEATDINGYAYALTGRLNYAYTETLSAALQVAGGKQHWQGSDWIPIADTRAKWPENNTVFISAFITICKYF